MDFLSDDVLALDGICEGGNVRRQKGAKTYK